jgi:hypothetical protein
VTAVTAATATEALRGGLLDHLAIAPVMLRDIECSFLSGGEHLKTLEAGADADAMRVR